MSLKACLTKMNRKKTNFAIFFLNIFVLHIIYL
jgi:hypothetical protein